MISSTLALLNLRSPLIGMLPLLDLLPDVFIFAKDLDHRFILSNAAHWRLHGCNSEAEILGKKDQDYYPPLLAQQYVEEDRQVMRSAKSILNQVWLVPQLNGIPFWYLCSKLPLQSKAGKVVGLLGVMRPYEQVGTAPEEYKRLLPALTHVRSHYAEALSVTNLAALVHLSASQFRREFQRMFHMSPIDYLQQVRLQRSRHLLEQSQQSITEIALNCGFHDPSHFTKKFKAATGLLPKVYRQRFSTQRPSLA
jgi:AraC-like DNA-binding protein